MVNTGETQFPKPAPLKEWSRKQMGLVNDIQPARPQPKPTKRTTIGGSKARKILKGQQ